jgi:hypothetical protein
MIAFYRTVYFRPRLSLDWRVPVAALLSVGDATTAVTAELLPDHRCLGGLGASELLHFGVAELAAADESDLPSSLGPHFELGPREELPTGLQDPATWVRSTALPHQERVLHIEPTTSELRLPKIAWNHLSKWGVSGYVQKRFRRKDAPELRRLPPKLPTVTHFVLGNETVLLMEPLTLAGSGVAERVAAIYSKFSSYGNAWDSSNGHRHHKMLAYVLPGPKTKISLAEITEQLGAVAAVYNTGITESREKFTDEIRRIGETGPRPELVG